MPPRWKDASRLARRSALALVLVLSYGTAVHIAQLAASGFPPYPDQPAWLRFYFTSLIVFDPLAAVLLWRRQRSGVALAVALLVSDAVANGIANYLVGTGAGFTAGRAGHAVITLLAICACAATPTLWRSTSVRPLIDGQQS